MRIDRNSNTSVEVTLSRTNLEKLLAKLDANEPAMAIRGSRNGPTLIVSAEPDERHYEDRV